MNYKVFRIFIAFIIVFTISGCFSKKEIIKPTIIKRVALSEIIKDALILDINKQDRFYILHVKTNLKNGETELISFKSLDIGESQVGDTVLISTRSGVATNIEIINKADKIQKAAVLEEAKKLDIKIEQELNTNQTSNATFLSPENSIKDETKEVKQDEKIDKKTDDTADIDTIFEKGIIDTKVTEEELKGKDLQKRTIDRKNKEINPPSSTKLDTVR